MGPHRAVGRRPQAPPPSQNSGQDWVYDLGCHISAVQNKMHPFKRLWTWSPRLRKIGATLCMCVFHQGLNNPSEG